MLDLASFNPGRASNIVRHSVDTVTELALDVARVSITIPWNSGNGSGSGDVLGSVRSVERARGDLGGLMMGEGDWECRGEGDRR